MVADAAAYWQDVLGVPVRVLAQPGPRQILVRAGEDLAPDARGRAHVVQVDSGNAIVSVLVVIRPDIVPCTVRGTYCRALYRHEIGHALGFFEHTDRGLMHAVDLELELSERERRMIVALYALPVGASVLPDGTWTHPDGQQGAVDPQTAIDIIAWNIESVAFQPIRQPNVTCRWVDDVLVYVME